MTMADNFARANAKRYPARDGAVVSVIGLAAITMALVGGIAIAVLVDALITDAVALMLADPAALIGGL